MSGKGDAGSPEVHGQYKETSGEKAMYGLTCGWCKKQINAANQELAEKQAHEEGWRYMDDVKKNAHVACPRCAREGHGKLTPIYQYWVKQGGISCG